MLSLRTLLKLIHQPQIEQNPICTFEQCWRAKRKKRFLGQKTAIYQHFVHRQYEGICFVQEISTVSCRYLFFRTTPLL